MKKLLIGFAVALSLLVTAVLVAPGLIDWNGHRASIARQLSALTGRTVTIDGPVDFALLPTPTLSARDVRVANPEGAASPELMTIGALDVRATLLPLLSGRIEADRIVLIDPVVVLETLPDGRPAWRQDGGFDPRSVQLDRVTVENGTVIWRDRRAGREERVDDIFAQFSAESLAGPFQLVGSLSVRERRLTVDLASGRLAGTGAVPVNATIGLDGASGELRFGGLVSVEPLRLQGDIRAEGGDFADILARLRPEMAPVPAAAQPFEITAALMATADAVELNRLALTFGDTRATGAAKLSFGPAPQVDLALAAGSLDLDALFAEGGIPPAADWWSAGFALPADWTATADLAVDALTWRGALTRDLDLEGVLSDGVLALNRLSAQLPGDADLSLVGTIRAEDGAPYADLSASLEASDLRRLLAWAGRPIEGVPGDRLRRFAGQARLAGTPDQFSLTGVDVTLDGSRVSGGLAYVDQGRPGFGLRLEIDRINLDAYRPDGRIAPVEDLWKPLVGLASRVDANVDATIGAATVAGTTLDGLRLDGTLSGGALTLRRAEIGALAGASIGITGRVGALDPLSGLDLTVDFAAEDLARFAETTGLDLPVPPARLDPVTLGGRIQGDPERLVLQLAGSLAGGTVELGGAVAGPFDEPVYDLAVRLGHPRLAEAIGVVLPGYAPRADLGPLDLYAEIDGPADRLAFAGLQGAVGPVSVAGKVTLDRTGARPAIDADLRTSAIPVDDFVPASRRGRLPPRSRDRWSNAPIDLSVLAGLDATLALTAAGITVGDFAVSEPALRARLDDGTLALDGLSGGLFGGRVGMAGQVETGTVPKLALSIDLVGADLAAVLAGTVGTDGLSGTLDFGVDLAGAGASEEELVASLSGEGLVAVRDGAVDGFDLAAASRQLASLTEPIDFLDMVEETLSRGRTPFATLNATFTMTGGVARTEDLRLVAEAGVGEGGGSIDLPRRQIDLTTEFGFYDHPEAPPFGLTLVGPLDDPQTRLQTQALQAYIAQRAAEALSERFLEAPQAPAGDASAPAPADG